MPIAYMAYDLQLEGNISALMKIHFRWKGEVDGKIKQVKELQERAACHALWSEVCTENLISVIKCQAT